VLKPLAMWTKIYFVLFAAAFLGLCVLTLLCYSQLQSRGFAPQDIEKGFLAYRNLYWQFLWISSLILLILANVILWRARGAWAVWTTFAFFAVFVLVQSWWLGGVYFRYAKENNLTESSFSLDGILGVTLCAAIAVAAFFNQFLVLRMRDRMHGDPESLSGTATGEEPAASEAVAESGPLNEKA
jgi:hypothetical protein